MHLCVDLTGRRLVVVKWMREELATGGDTAARFQREAELLSKLSIPGVIKVDAYGTDENSRTWMAMEFVDGLSPAAVIHPGDAHSVHRLLAGLGESLDALHAANIVHRDLKPENVLLRPTPDAWQPVILDMGVAKWLAQRTATATGSVFGTPYYMSPEQFRDSKHVGPATDRYALAVMAYELMCGVLPYDGRNLTDLLYQHVELEVPSLRVAMREKRRQRATLPELRTEPMLRETPALDAFMQVAMAKQPEERYPSAKAMAEAFERAAKLDSMWSEPTRSEPLFEPLTHPILHISVADRSLTLDLREGPIVFGRHEACQVQLTSPRLSRMHACIYEHRGRVWFADLHSQNGSACEGKTLRAGVPLPLHVSEREANLLLYDHDIRVRASRG